MTNYKTATVYGWGDTIKYDYGPSYFAFAEKLKQTTLPMSNQWTCEFYISRDKLTPDMLCAKVDKMDTDSCQGDSGGQHKTR